MGKRTRQLMAEGMIYAQSEMDRRLPGVFPENPAHDFLRDTTHVAESMLELLAACQAWETYFESGKLAEFPALRDQIRSAVAKATTPEPHHVPNA